MLNINTVLESINESNEVFVESEYKGQTHNQMIENPIAELNNDENKLYIQSLNVYGEYSINLDDLDYIEDVGLGDFDYYINLKDSSSIHITNEW